MLRRGFGDVGGAVRERHGGVVPGPCPGVTSHVERRLPPRPLRPLHDPAHGRIEARRICSRAIGRPRSTASLAAAALATGTGPAASAESRHRVRAQEAPVAMNSS
ncbi:MAG: hypothetical protein L0H79_20705, partial [Intrasporangium sp.]|uniref:hypothetical protein n=1 Tax=Intrasporangium sp. TaxID=1925024 RepID=UPI0026471806